jgi:hypothetical protein
MACSTLKEINFSSMVTFPILLDRGLIAIADIVGWVERSKTQHYP